MNRCRLLGHKWDHDCAMQGISYCIRCQWSDCEWMPKEPYKTTIVDVVFRIRIFVIGIAPWLTRRERSYWLKFGDGLVPRLYRRIKYGKDYDSTPF